MNRDQVNDSMRALLEAAVEETGIELKQSAADLAAFAAMRAAHLAELVDDPGFELAVRAERDILAARAGLTAHQQARKADARLLGIVQGAISMGARALAVAAVA